MIRYQVFFVMADNACNQGVADISPEFLEKFNEGRIITKITAYEEKEDFYKRRVDKQAK